MSYNDYCIMFDNNGEPYIQHSDSVVPRLHITRTDEDHKYVYRLDLPDGSRRYFYSMEEYQAYLKREKEDKQKKRDTDSYSYGVDVAIRHHNVRSKAEKNGDRDIVEKIDSDKSKIKSGELTVADADLALDEYEKELKRRELRRRKSR